jgi:uncharacterized protein
VAAPLRLVRFADVPSSPWRNGRGTTRELLVSSSGAAEGFDWRVSVANVDEGGPFSSFPGTDRVLMLCHGSGMTLVIDGEPVRLTPHEPVVFAGEAATSAVLEAGPTTDLNVMTRRGVASAGVATLVVADTLEVASEPGATTVLVVLADELQLAAFGVEQRLGCYDTVVVEGRVTLSGRGSVARIDLRIQRDQIVMAWLTPEC